VVWLTHLLARRLRDEAGSPCTPGPLALAHGHQACPFFLESSFITHSTEDKARFGPKAAASPVSPSSMRSDAKTLSPAWQFRSRRAPAASKDTSERHASIDLH
jgi:hypothetical protein